MEQLPYPGYRLDDEDVFERWFDNLSWKEEVELVFEWLEEKHQDRNIPNDLATNEDVFKSWLYAKGDWK
jgi:hypothetical protein